MGNNCSKADRGSASVHTLKAVLAALGASSLGPELKKHANSIKSQKCNYGFISPCLSICYQYLPGQTYRNMFSHTWYWYGMQQYYLINTPLPTNTRTLHISRTCTHTYILYMQLSCPQTGTDNLHHKRYKEGRESMGHFLEIKTKRINTHTQMHKEKEKRKRESLFSAFWQRNTLAFAVARQEVGSGERKHRMADDNSFDILLQQPSTAGSECGGNPFIPISHRWCERFRD